MDKLNTSLGSESEDSSQVTKKPMIKPVISSINKKIEKDDSNKLTDLGESTKIDKESSPFLHKIDHALKEIDTTGEYLLVTIVALLVGVVIGLLITYIL